MKNTSSRRINETPFKTFIENAGVKDYTIYNRTYLATVFDTLENDYVHLNKYVQIWDVSCQKQVEVSGNNALDFIQKLTPRDLSILNLEKCLYIPIINQFGKILNDPVIFKIDNNKYRLSMSDSDLYLLLQGFSLSMDFNINLTMPEIYTIAVQGPKSKDLIEKIFGKNVSDLKKFQITSTIYEYSEIFISKTGFSSSGGYEIYLDNSEVSKNLWKKIFILGNEFNIKVGCPNLIDRIEGGLLSFGNDIDFNDTALESGLSHFCDLNTDIDCVGIYALRDELKYGIKKIIRYFIIESDKIGVCDQPWDIIYNDKKIGYITSSAYSPSFNKNVSIGMVNYEFSNIKFTVEIRTPFGLYPAKVYSKPLKYYRNTKEI